MASAFHIENFGCRAARADGEAVNERLRAAGLSEGRPATADVVIVNTCSVTAEADRAARAFIRRTHRQNPEARIMVTGCYAQRAPEELAGLEGVAAVVGNSHKALAPQIAANLARGINSMPPASPAGMVPVGSVIAPIWADDRFAHSFLEEAQVVPGAQTRPNLKIQEGCTNRCTFCVIPQTRGSSRSLGPDAILRQVEGFVAAGGKELVLSGINLGRWGRDLPHQPGAAGSLAELARQIFSHTSLVRLRLSSIEPMDCGAELIGLMREFGGSRTGSPATGPGSPRTGLGSWGGDLRRWGVRLARHAHLPLQSGSDAVLRRMHRRYRPWHYAEKVEALVEAAGTELTLGADVMVGFPGESDREFEETVEFVRALPFGYLHLFPFSPRPGTRGWALHAASPVPVRAVDERMAALRALAAEKTEAHRRQFIGRELEAITLHTPQSDQAQGRTAALTENFLPVEIDAALPANELVRARVCAVGADLILRGTNANSIPPRAPGPIRFALVENPI